jgi:hypothetical protein
MANLAATDWTETVEERNIEGKHKRNRVKLVLSVTTANAYPTSGGIPLPTTMGMVRNIDYVNIIQPPTLSGATGPMPQYLWAYDRENHGLRGWSMAATQYTGAATALPELPTTWKPSLGYAAAPVMYVEAVGW